MLHGHKCSVGVWPDGDLLDTAYTLSRFLGGNSDVSLFSPAGSPGVSDNVVLLSVLGSVSDSSDSVVESGSRALRLRDNTTGVVHESVLLGIDGDGNWSLLDGGLQGRGGVGRNFVDVGDRDMTRIAAGVAGSVSGSVSVVGLEILSVGLNVVHGIFLPSTVATSARGVAVNNLLLGERDEVSSGDSVVSLNSASGREGPAGSAFSLVLDGVDGTLLSPVNRGSSWHGELEVFWEGLWSLVSQESLLLSRGQVGELVVSISGRSVHGVKLSNISVGLLELLESEFVFLFGSVGLSVLNNVAHERSLDGGDFGVGGSRGSEEGNGSHVVDFYN
jgi:hypothetical protein